MSSFNNLDIELRVIDHVGHQLAATDSDDTHLCANFVDDDPLKFDNELGFDDPTNNFKGDMEWTGYNHRAPGHEGNVLKHNTNISSTTNSKDDVLEIGSIPDTIPVSEQGPPPSQTTSDAQDDNGRRGQTRFEDAKHKCKECRQGFNRKQDYVRHLGSIGHNRKTRSEGEQGTIEASFPFKCTEAGCVSAYTRDDALKRHMRCVHQEAR